MWAMIVKESRQLRRDRRTLAMMIVMPVLLLVVLGYAEPGMPVALAGKTLRVPGAPPEEALRALANAGADVAARAYAAPATMQERFFQLAMPRPAMPPAGRRAGVTQP